MRPSRIVDGAVVPSPGPRAVTASAVTPQQWSEISAAHMLSFQMRPPTVPGAAPFSARFSGQVVDRRLALADITAGPCRMSRGSRSADAGPDVVFLTIQRAGTFRVEQAGRMARVRAGEAVLYRSRGALELECEDRTTCLTLQVPVDPSGLRPAALQAALARTLPASGPVLHLLSATSEALAAAAPGLPPAASARASSAVLDLLDVLLGSLEEPPGPADPPGGPSGLATGMQRFLLDHLDQPDLSVASIARRFGVSSRYVTRVFTESGVAPPATFLREERLRRATGLLERSPATPLAAVAARCGFTDVSTFTRAFRRRHGCSPGAWRRESGAPTRRAG